MTAPRLERLRDPRVVVPLAIGLGLAVRLGRIARAPLVHPDGPAYLDLSAAVLDGRWATVFGSYYSPLYPLAIAPLLALGVDRDLAGRLVAALAGVATIPLVFCLARRTAGDRAAPIAALLAAVQPALVKSGANVLPETLAGLALLATAEVVYRTRSIGGFAGGGALAGLAYLARPEGVLAAVLGVVVAGRRHGPPALAVFALAVGLVMSPAVLLLHARTGVWQLSPREAALAERSGVAAERSLAAAAVRAPASLATRWTSGVGRQLWNTLVALGPVLAIPFAAGLWTTRARPRWPLAIVLAFAAGPLALNPSPRYAVPTLPFLLPATAAGVGSLASRLGARATMVGAAALGVLVVQGLWKSKPFDERCAYEVRDLLLARYGPGQALVAIDGRFAYLAQGRSVVPKATAPAAALALAASHGARLWLTRPHWIGRRFAMPPDVHEVARPCGGAFVLYEIGAGDQGG